MKWLSSIGVTSLVLALAAPAFADASPAHPGAEAPAAAAAAEAHAAGPVSRYVVGPTGHVRGFLLGNDVVVLLAPRQGDAMAKEVLVGQTVQVDARSGASTPKILFHAAVYGPHGQVAAAPAPHAHKALDKAAREQLRTKHKEELAKLAPESTQATVKAVVNDRRGMPQTLLLSNGASVFLDRSLARALGSRTIRVGEAVTASGRGGNYPLGTSILANELTFPDGARVQGAAR